MIKISYKYIIDIHTDRFTDDSGEYDTTSIDKWFTDRGLIYGQDYSWSSSLYYLRIRVDDLELATFIRLAWG